jgi:hypothetical protein
MRAHHGSGVRAYARAAEAGGHYRGIADMAGLVAGSTRLRMSSRPEEFHLRALPEPCMTLSSHTAPDVRPLP